MENKQMLEEFLELVQIPVNSRNERQIACLYCNSLCKAK